MSERDPELARSPDDLIPRPDPSTLTDTAVTRAKDDLRRELRALREVLEAQIAAVAAEMHQTWALHKADVERERTERNALKEIVFDKFHERDLRFGALDRARQEALENALRTAAELVNTKAQAAQAAATKFEEAIVRQLNDQVRSNQESRDRLAVQVTELEKRLAASSGAQTGAAESRTEQRESRTERRLDTGTLTGIIGVVLAVVAIAVSIIIATRGH